jgi:capsular polysaccharide biosynthesis protein
VELSGYLAVAKRWWWTLVVAAWVAGLTGYLVASTLPPTYESQVKVLVGPLNTDLDTLRASGQLIQTYAQVVTNEELLASTIQELGLDLSPEDLRSATRATANDVTRILTIRVQAGDPEQAAQLANELATELEQLTSGGISRPEGLTKILEFARPDTVPVAPQVSLLVLLAALAGVVVAVVVVLLIEYFGNTVRTREELASLARAPGLGVVPTPSGNPVGLVDLVVERAPDSRSAAPYRLIAAKLALSGDENPLRSILVTDADWEAEAAIVAGNLAAALAKLGRAVVLIDGSGPDGTLTALNGWKGRDGLAELLSDSVRPASRTDAGVRVVPAGRDEAVAVDPDRMSELIGDLAGQHGVVVIVGGPIQASPNTLALARATDGVILVARRDRARREDVVFAGESIRLVGASILGVILTERGAARRLRREQDLPSAAPALPLDVQPAASAVRTRRRARGEPPVAAPDRASAG